ncbi:MAG: glycosyltransferase family 4 protein [Myxacorys californica WJT36-NPBG1]|jgi:glycosyltransferase involved in cell wall biosynthesis|nr:glycosyltransferase family 4 protein [Myxacorys californica WJT36-NPBG1]
MSNQKTIGFLLKRVDCNDGVSSHCETLINGLKKAGWNVVLITGPVSYDHNSIRRFKALQDIAEEWIIFEHLNPLFPSIDCLRRLKSVVSRHGISLFHAHGYSMLVLARILKIITGIGCVATYHPSIHGDDPKALKAETLNSKTQRYKLFLRLFSPEEFISYSSEITSFLRQDLGFPETRIRRIFHGIDTDYFRVPNSDERQAARQKFGFAPSDKVCVLVGRLSWNKGHDVLIEAARHLREKSPHINLKCLFVGSGSEEKQIKEYAFTSVEDAERFKFLGYVDHLREAYWAADVFTLPSRSEGFALAVAEAMCCGAVPIRTPAGGAKDQIDEGLNGFVVPFDDSEALSDRLQLLLDQDQLRSQMSEAARNTAQQKFSVTKMVQDTVKLYKEVQLGISEDLIVVERH